MTPKPCLLRTFARARSAAAAVEMALLAPVLVLMAAGLIDFGLGIYTKMMVADAAQSGAAYAQLNAVNYLQTPCASNANPACAWDQSIVAAATKSHGASTLFSTAITATANVLFCCIASGSVDVSNCTQPPAAAPSCSPAAGIYVQVVASSQYNTLLPYHLASGLLNYTIPRAIPMQSIYLVRIH
ncbi:MAG TPA: TadE/TadG family type IV pilus assembly protein [Stellaceae bacterium]|nr:TadE/TadG family type IV pilus assembly protein [Stellaceae bacterium]